jgi:hypothetical protein
MYNITDEQMIEFFKKYVHVIGHEVLKDVLTIELTALNERITSIGHSPLITIISQKIQEALDLVARAQKNDQNDAKPVQEGTQEQATHTQTTQAA